MNKQDMLSTLLFGGMMLSGTSKLPNLTLNKHVIIPKGCRVYTFTADAVYESDSIDTDEDNWCVALNLKNAIKKYKKWLSKQSDNG